MTAALARRAEAAPIQLRPARRLARLRWRILREVAAFLAVAGSGAVVILFALGVS